MDAKVPPNPSASVVKSSLMPINLLHLSIAIDATLGEEGLFRVRFSYFGECELAVL
jgi:hypothetical protein